MSNTKPSLKEQMIWVMSDLSNINAGKFYVHEENLQANADQIPGIIAGTDGDTTIADFLGNQFKVVWGPVLSNKTSTVDIKVVKDAQKHDLDPDMKVTGFSTTNLLYVAKGKFPGATVDSYVIATAGTNVDSPAGWFQEDFKVRKTVAWPPSYLGAPGVSGAGSISEGSSNGLQTLWHMQDSHTGKSVHEFISDVLKSTDDSEVLTCGHSLGGALSPILALALINKRPADSGATIASYPTAGASSGNPDFANYATKQFAGNYFSRVNNFDIVPHAWSQKDSQGFDMADIANIYKNLDFLDVDNVMKGLSASAVINGFACWAKNRRKPLLNPENQYARISGDTPFSGGPVKVVYSDMIATVNGLFSKSTLAKTAFFEIVKKCGGDTDNLVNLTADFISFAAQAGAQHTIEYTKEFLSDQPSVQSKLSEYVDLHTLNPAAAAVAEEIVNKLVTDVVLSVNIHGCGSN